MKPLCHELADSEVARLGELSPEDFAEAGVSENLVPFVWGVAQTLHDARQNPNNPSSKRMESAALGEHASWGRRGDRCSTLDYLVRNVQKALVREGKCARRRSYRPRDYRRAEDHEPQHAFEGFLRDTPYWRVAKDVVPEPGETLDEYVGRYHQECRRRVAASEDRHRTPR